MGDESDLTPDRQRAGGLDWSFRCNDEAGDMIWT